MAFFFKCGNFQANTYRFCILWVGGYEVYWCTRPCFKETLKAFTVSLMTMTYVYLLWVIFLRKLQTLRCLMYMREFLTKAWFTIWRWALRRVVSILGQVGRLCPKSTSLGRKQEHYVGYAGVEFGSIPVSRCVSTAFQRGMARRDAALSVILWTSL